MNSAQRFLFLACLLPVLIIGITKYVDSNRRKSLKSQDDFFSIQGKAASSLATGNMRIKKSNREKGIIGELGVAKDLDYLAEEYGLTVLHDLSIPGSKANIDHILITRKAVFVIDSKNYTGQVKISPNKAGKKVLRVGGRDQSTLVEKINFYSESVKKYLELEGTSIKVIPILAFYQAQFHKDTRITIDGVKVNVFGIENELLRNANVKSTEFDIQETASNILKHFSPKI